MRLPKRPESETPAPEQVTSGPTPYSACAIDRTGRIVVASGAVRSAIWSLPADSNAATIHGAMTPVVVEGERQLMMSMTADGKQVLFQAVDRRGVARYILHRLDSGEETILGLVSVLNSVLLTRDGRWLTVEGSLDKGNKTLPHFLNLPSNLGVLFFPDLRTHWDVSRDGSRALAAGIALPRSVILETMRPEGETVLLQHPSLNLYLANFSSDDRWILFTAENGLDPPHLFAAPFRPPYPIAISQWVDLGEGAFGRWAPAGNRIYFLRDHQGSRCLYTLALDPASKRPLGEATAVQHFHSAWRSPSQLEPGAFRLLVAQDKLVFSLGETQSNLWLSEK